MSRLQFESETEWQNSIRLGVQHGHIEPAQPAVALKADKVVAYVNHGRWIGDCSTCGAARVLHRDRPYWCVVCGNSKVGGLALPILWPSDKEMSQIEAVLSVREPANQNFDPVEHLRTRHGAPCPDAVTWLAYENLERGLQVPDDIIRAKAEKWILADWAARGLDKEMAGFNPEKAKR